MDQSPKNIPVFCNDQCVNQPTNLIYSSPIQKIMADVKNSNVESKQKVNPYAYLHTFDPDGFRRRAACVCVKNELENEVLLVSSTKFPDKWIVPGGGVDPDEEPSVTAVREVFEEAGVRGKLGRCLGSFECPIANHRTVVYVLYVTEELDEWDESKNKGRKRKWFSIDEAIRHLGSFKPVQCSYVKLLKKEDTVP